MRVLPCPSMMMIRRVALVRQLLHLAEVRRLGSSAPPYGPSSVAGHSFPSPARWLSGPRAGWRLAMSGSMFRSQHTEVARRRTRSDGCIGEVPRLPHHRVDRRFELVVAELPADPASRAARATATAIAREATRRSTVADRAGLPRGVPREPRPPGRRQRRGTSHR